MKASHVGEAGSRVREERLEAARRVVEAARSAAAEFVLVAGDTFEDNGVDRILVQKVADLLAGFSGPVYIIPGNHDPLMPGCVWEHPSWKTSKNVRILKDEKAIELPGGTLFPCPIKAKHSGKDPTAWIPVEHSGGIRIGISHGTVEGIQLEEQDYPIARDAAARCGLDYLALGHWHSMATYAGPEGALRMAYSGTHETTSFGERDSGNVLMVEIAGPRSIPAVNSIRTGGLVWLRMEGELRAPGDADRLRERIENIASPGTTLLDIPLFGLLSPLDREVIIHLEEILASRFLWARLDTTRIRPAPEDKNWVAGLPPGILREAAGRLQILADPACPGQRPEGGLPEVAARALLELYALIGGGGR
jgi:DNA repair exonuclease SbcCD nuclease subunit